MQNRLKLLAVRPASQVFIAFVLALHIAINPVEAKSPVHADYVKFVAFRTAKLCHQEIGGYRSKMSQYRPGAKRALNRGIRPDGLAKLNSLLGATRASLSTAISRHGSQAGRDVCDTVLRNLEKRF